MNPLAGAVTSLAATLQSVAGYPGSYSRFGTGPAALTGTPTVRTYEVIDPDDGTMTLVKSFDWLFAITDIEALYPPQPGDQWTVEGGEADFALPFQAMPIGNRPCFEPHDAHGQMVVVHMKRVAHA